MPHENSASYYLVMPLMSNVPGKYLGEYSCDDDETIHMLYVLIWINL